MCHFWHGSIDFFLLILNSIFLFLWKPYKFSLVVKHCDITVLVLDNLYFKKYFWVLFQNMFKFLGNNFLLISDVVLFMLYFLVKHGILWLSWIPSSIYLIQEDYIILHHGLLFLHCCLETLSSQYSGSMIRFTSIIPNLSASSALWCLLPSILRQCFMVFCCYF